LPGSLFLQLRLPACLSFGAPLRIGLNLFGGSCVWPAGTQGRQGKKIGGFEQGDLFPGVLVACGGGFQSGDGVGAAELFGGFNGGFPDFLLGAGQIGQDVGQGGRVVVRGPLLEAVGLGIHGGLALFRRQGAGGN